MRFLDVLLNRKGKRVYELVEIFKTRLRRSDIENIREMVNHNEWYEGFDILCAQLYEWHSPITLAEYNMLRDFVQDIPVNWEHDYLKQLIQ